MQRKKKNRKSVGDRRRGKAVFLLTSNLFLYASPS